MHRYRSGTAPYGRGICGGSHRNHFLRIGISEEEQQHLFDAFRRGANVGDIEGVGLGLSIVKQFVELHGGTISVESEVNKGTTFTVILPIRD